MTDKQIIEKIEEIIAPYQTEIELDCLSLPIAIESILERKEQESEELKQRIKEQAKELWDKTTQIRALTSSKNNNVCDIWDLDMLGY